MRYSVVITRRNGVRLTRSEIAAQEPLVGELTISDWPADATSATRRAMRVAKLKAANGNPDYAADLLAPIFDATVVRVTESSMLIVGFAIITVDGKACEVQQGWLCRPADQSSVK